MGIFARSRDERAEAASKLKHALLKELTGLSMKQSIALANRIEEFEKHPEQEIIRPFLLFLEMTDIIIHDRSIRAEEWPLMIRKGEVYYKGLFPLGENSSEFDENAEVFLLFFVPGSVVKKDFYVPELFRLFRDKRNYVRLVQSLEIGKDDAEKRELVLNLALRSRVYFMDEEAFTGYLVAFVTDSSLSEHPKEETVDRAIDELRRMSGVYNVSEERIALSEQKLDAVQLATASLQDSITLSESRMQAINEISSKAMGQVKDYCDGELLRAKTRVDNLRESMDRVHDEFMNVQREGILAEKDELLNKIYKESEDKLLEMRKAAEQIVSGARQELKRINADAGSIAEKLEGYIKDREKIKDILADAAETKVLSEKIDRLMLLPDVALKQPEPPMPPEPMDMKPPMEGPGPIRITPPTPAPAPASSKPVDRFEDFPQNTEEISEMLPTSVLLDESVPFASRFSIAMEQKHKMELAGEHFHRMFDDVLTAVMENANPYLIGPSGCGKTFMVRQISEILNVGFVDIGYINEEYDILGFQTADGGYSKPNFYRCYKYGRIAFCDELDNGNSRATVKLNSFLSNRLNASYSFPNGENVLRNPNFRIIAAGNTTGNGADANYNSREKIEESVQQRFTPIYVGYDNEVERAILSGHQDWYEFIVLFRKATDAWTKYTHFSASGIVTTRDAERIQKYLENGSFSPQKIIEYVFVQTKEVDYLEYLSKTIGAEIENMSDSCRVIYGYFYKRVAELASGEDTVRSI